MNSEEEYLFSINLVKKGGRFFVISKHMRERERERGDGCTVEKRFSILLKYVRPQSNKISLSYSCHYSLDSVGFNLHSYRGFGKISPFK